MPNSPGQHYVEVGKYIPPLHINWQMLPHPFKTYQGSEQIRLNVAPLIEDLDGTNELTFEQFSSMLFDLYGLVRTKNSIHSSVTAFRTVASGGALFPCELYLLANGGQVILPGVYHYHPAQHALDVLRRGNYIDDVIDNASFCEDGIPEYILLLSCQLWKNGFKYRELSYRLQSLDIGVMIAQCQFVAAHYGLSANVHYQFVDTTLNNLLGLDPSYESVYVVIGLTSLYKKKYEKQEERKQQVPQETLPETERGPAFAISHWPELAAVHHASFLETTATFQKLRQIPTLTVPTGSSSYPYRPSDRAIDLWRTRQRRHSTSGYFAPKYLTLAELSMLAESSTQGYINDVDGNEDGLRHVILYCVVQYVHDMQPGVYCYNSHRHTFELVRDQEQNKEIQALFFTNVILHNILHASVYFFPVGNYEDGFLVYGDRWYRMQNMEAGILLHRLYLAAAALGLGCRASLGYEVEMIDQGMNLPTNFTSLALAAVGHERMSDGQYEQLTMPPRRTISS